MSELQEQQEVVEYDRKDLKILALKQEVADKSEQVADLRAELTETIDAANKQIKAMAERIQELQAKVPDELEDEVEVSVEEPDSGSDK